MSDDSQTPFCPPDAIRADPRMARFLEWVAKRPPGFASKVPGKRQAR